jgi:hypothetical protein
MLAVDKLNLYEKYSGHDRQIYEDTLHLAEKIAAQQFYPVNAEGDHVGISYDRTSGTVTTPESFKPAYQAMARAGFIGVSADPDFGGLGMPLAVSVACKEYFCSACGSLTFYALLTGSAAQLVHSFGTQQQKRLYLPQMLSGAWGGTMCLTEPNAGSEVGNVKTRAIPQENSAYLISGQKIFISAAENTIWRTISFTWFWRALMETPPAPGGYPFLSSPNIFRHPTGHPLNAMTSFVQGSSTRWVSTAFQPAHCHSVKMAGAQVIFLAIGERVCGRCFR